MKTLLLSLSTAGLLHTLSLGSGNSVAGKASGTGRVPQLFFSPNPTIQLMETQPQRVVRDFLTAVQHNQFDLVGAALHPQVQWSQPGHNRFSGPKHSRDEVFAMVGAMQEAAAGTLALTAIDALSENGHQVACRVHWKAAQPPGGLLDVDNIDVYTVENGLITQVQVFSADAAHEDAFWGK